MEPLRRPTHSIAAGMNATSPDTSHRRLDNHAFDILFRQARTHSAWLDRPVEDDVLRQLYDLMKWGPTSANCCPVRIVFLRTPAAKARLRPALMPGNVDKTMKAPVTAIVGYDSKFLRAAAPAISRDAGDEQNVRRVVQPLADTTAMRNGSLQGGYFYHRGAGARSRLRPDVRLRQCQGRIWSFSRRRRPNPEISLPPGTVKSNFLCNLGYGDAPRSSIRGGLRLQSSKRRCQLL